MCIKSSKTQIDERWLDQGYSLATNVGHSHIYHIDLYRLRGETGVYIGSDSIREK